MGCGPIVVAHDFTPRRAVTSRLFAEALKNVAVSLLTKGSFGFGDTLSTIAVL